MRRRKIGGALWFISMQGSGVWSLDAVRNRHTVATFLEAGVS